MTPIVATKRIVCFDSLAMIFKEMLNVINLWNINLIYKIL
jgi:hypothetical protein